MYARDTILCKRRLDLEVRWVETVWVELQIKRKQTLFGGFYKPRNRLKPSSKIFLLTVPRRYFFC